MEERQETVMDILHHLREEVCMHLCRYLETTDEDFVCDYVREHGYCPLDRL